MNEAKEKDRILAEIKARKSHKEIVGLNKHLDEFIKDSYVRCSFATDGSIITIRITPQGDRLLENGGYTKIGHKAKRAKVKSELSNAFKFLLAALVGGVIDRLLQIIFDI